MATRRGFIRDCVAISAVATTSAAVFANSVRAVRAAPAVDAGAARPGRSPIPFVFLHDRTLAGEAFGAAVADHGHVVQAIGADPGAVWRDLLEPRLRLGPAAVAGLTCGATLFCLELLARGYGLGTVYRIEHERLAGGGYRHAVESSTALAVSLPTQGGWAERAGAHAATCFPARDSRTPLALVDLNARAGRAETPFTWLLAPAEQHKRTL